MAVSRNLIDTSSCGKTRLKTSDGTAWAELAGHGQTLTVCYLAKLPHDKLEIDSPLDDSLSELTMSGETTVSEIAV